MNAVYLSQSEEKRLHELETKFAASNSTMSFEEKRELKKLQEIAEAMDEEDDDYFGRGGDKYSDY